MNKYIEAALRGCVQGLTEFLPVSSSGHLLLLPFGRSLFFDIMLHVATLMVIILRFRKEIFAIFKNPFGGKAAFIIISSIPTAIMAGLIRYFLYDYSLQILPFCFMATAALLFSTKFSAKIPFAAKWKNGNLKCALITGIVQGFACLSGISRSGATISALTHLGYDSESSNEYTFLLAIPIILGSALVEFLCYEGTAEISGEELIIGMVSSFLFGLLAINTFIKTLKKGKIWMFSIYAFFMSFISFYVIYF